MPDLQPDRGEVEASPGAPLSQGHIADAALVLRDWAAATGGPQKLAVTLAHRYTAAGLAWDALKGIDGARARILAAAARQADCYVSLALLTLWEHGSAENDDEPYWSGWGRRGGRHRAEEYTLGEVFDSSLSAKRWRSPEGERLPFGEIPFEKEEIVPPESLTDVKPKEDFEGYTGNEGMTLERRASPRRGGALAPRAARGGSLHAREPERGSRAQADGEEVAGCSGRGRRRSEGALPRAGRPDSPALAGERPARRGDGVDRGGQALRPERTAGSAGRHGADPNVLPRGAREGRAAQPGSWRSGTVDRCGWAVLRADLVALFEATDGETLPRNARLLERLCRFRRADMDEGGIGADQQETCALLAAATLAALERIDAQKPSPDWRGSRVDRTRILPRLARALLGASAPIAGAPGHPRGIRRRATRCEGCSGQRWPD